MRGAVGEDGVYRWQERERGYPGGLCITVGEQQQHGVSVCPLHYGRCPLVSTVSVRPCSPALTGEGVYPILMSGGREGEREGGREGEREGERGRGVSPVLAEVGEGVSRIHLISFPFASPSTSSRVVGEEVVIPKQQRHHHHQQ